ATWVILRVFTLTLFIRLLEGVKKPREIRFFSILTKSLAIVPGCFDGDLATGSARSFCFTYLEGGANSGVAISRLSWWVKLFLYFSSNDNIISESYFDWACLMLSRIH